MSRKMQSGANSLFEARSLRENQETTALENATSMPMMGPQRWKVACICAGLLALVWTVFGQTLGFDFVNYDDDVYITRNPVVQNGVTLKGVWWAFGHGEIGHWHPLTWLTHMADCHIYGQWAGGHHLTNILIHGATAMGLFCVLRNMIGSLWRSAFVAAVWAVHPLRAESVAWVAERKDVMAGLFFVLTLGAYMRYAHRPERIRYLWVLGFFTTGLLAKNMLITLPFVLLLLDWWPLARVSKVSVSRLLMEKVPFFALSAISCVITLSVPEKIPGTEQLPIWLRIQNAIVSCVIYLWQTVWPTILAVHYPNPSQPFSFWEVACALGILCILSATAFFLRKEHPGILIGWLWFVGMLVPVIGLVQISNYAHADRYTYLPQIGLWIMAVSAGGTLCSKWRWKQRVSVCLSVIVVATLTATARKQVAYWKDSETLWTHTLACTKLNSIAHNNLGYAMDQVGKRDEAIAHYHEALRINPAYKEAHLNLGIALLQNGQVDESIAEFRSLVRVNPADKASRNNLGHALMRKGQIDEAITHYEEALRISPTDAEAYNNLGTALLQTGRVDEATVQFREALRIKPDYSLVHNNLGNALLRNGLSEEAISEFRNALRINPEYAEAHYNLGNALLQKGRDEEAIAEFRTALQMAPDYVEARNNLGNALLKKGRVENAVQEFLEALRIKPSYSEARYNLGNALLRQGRIPEAVAEFREVVRLNPSDAEAMYLLAYNLATTREEGLRNGTEALEIAQKANSLTQGSNPFILATIATAYAEIGKFAEAEGAVRRAIKLATEQGNESLANTLHEHLTLYQMRQPVRLPTN